MNISDKETRAMFLNFKERRCLEKNMTSLDIEQAYNISLINLDQKIIKVNQKKLKDRTSRIKTNLSEDEIEEFQRLEMEGNLGVKESASKMDFKIRIAAASKRLKLQPRAKSAVPRIGMNGKLATATPRFTPRSARPSRKESIMAQSDDANFPLPRSLREERRQSISLNTNSVYIESGKDTSRHEHPIIHEPKADSDSKRKNGDVRTDAFVRTPKVSVNDSKRRKSVDFSNPVVNKKGGVEKVYVESPRPIRPQNLNIDENENAKSMCLLSVPEDTPSPRTVTTKDAKIRPLSVPATQVTDFSTTDLKNRPSTTTSHAVNVRKKSAADISRVSRLLASGKTSKSFSSHDATNKENKTKKEKPFRSIRDSNISSVDVGGADIKVGEDLYKEMKRSMVLGEVAASLLLEEKLDYFIEKMDSYKKKDNSQLNSIDQDIQPVAVSVAVPIAQGSVGQVKKPKQKRNVLRRRQLETRLQDEGGNDNGENDELWKDVNKCRYLRVPEEMIDLTGINTLAKDQLRMFDVMRQADEVSDG